MFADIMKDVTCCGAVIYRLVNGVKEFLVLKMHLGGHWDFPKGHMEEGEKQEECALREVKEETGLSVSLVPGFRETISYVDTINQENKTVVFFLAEASSGKVKIQKSEVLDYKWLSFEDALGQLTYENSKEMFRRCAE